jgi:hypothetical protein
MEAATSDTFTRGILRTSFESVQVATLREAAPALAFTVVALHDRIAELEATLAAERGRAVKALPSLEEQALAALAAREAARVVDPALKVGHLRAVIVEPATACQNEIPGGGGARVICADPESCAKHGCGYLESLGDGEVKS